MRQERIRPCQAVMDDGVRCACFRARIKVVRPLCCYADSRQVLLILTAAALLYSIVALVLTCIYAPHPFFIVTLAFSIITMCSIITGVITGSHPLIKVAYILTVILSVLAVIGSVICAISVIRHLEHAKDWKMRLYLFTMFFSQAFMILYVIGMTCAIRKVIEFNRTVCEEERRAELIEPSVRFSRY